jgi:hypothetical protein
VVEYPPRGRLKPKQHIRNLARVNESNITFHPVLGLLIDESQDVVRSLSTISW